MHYLVSLLLVAFLPFATGEKCKAHGGECDQICGSDTVAGAINDCAGPQYCCVKKNPARGSDSANGCSDCLDRCKGDSQCRAECAPQCPDSGRDMLNAGGKAQSGAGTPAAAETAHKGHFAENILVCSPRDHKYVSSNAETLVCNSDYTSLGSLYKDGFRLIQIVDNGNKAIYYLEKR
jgi:hypothetical protein